jgi:GTP cyclohydrolase I
MDLTDSIPNRWQNVCERDFGGLNQTKLTFENNYKYGEMLVEKNITLYSTCEHHLLPIIGRAHVAYISNGRSYWSFKNESYC